jgi:hypothetical protein
VGTGDVDLFQIVVPDNGTLFIDIDSPFADGEQVDSYLRIFEIVNGQVRQAVFEDTGARIVSDDDLAPDEELFGEEVYDSDGTFVGYRTDSYIAGTVERGDVYYIGVSDYENQGYDPNTLNGRSTAEPGGFYNLIVTFANNDLNGSITQARTDASLPITNFPGIIGADGNPQTGELRQVGNKDVDFRRITSTTAGILEVDIDSYTVSQISDPVDTVAFIFDAEGNLLASNDDDPDSVDPRLQLQIAANTPYYVAVTGYGNDNFDPFALGSGTGGDTGEYRFNSRLLPSSQAAVLSDNTSNSGSVEAIALNSSLSGNVGVDGSFITGATDVDIYRFVSPVTGVVEISTNTNQTFSADTFLRFFDRSGNEIAFNDNESNATRGSRLRVNVNANTEYLIGVNGYSANARDYNPITGAGAAPGSRGTYTLSLEQSVDPANYGSSHPDLIRGIGYNLEALLNHYRNSGRAEGRATDTFDEYRYIASNPDLINAFGVNGPAALEHYIRSGFLENRPTTTFNPEQYLASYPDLINALRYNPAAATNHYIASGFAEGRSPDAFPENRYVAGYDDLLNIFASNPSAATQHYITNGWGEGRSPYAFNPDLYIASYPDLIQALRYNLEQGTQHYINSGRWEGRSRGIFNPVNYLARYGDLRAAFGNNLELATRHYIESGFFEGRSDHE